ncbi:MAG: LysM peptidoglycan-binding domain-containing protein [Verrucomicrobia bacterium]|nr:LysM peptidoglycan-binding domain-containing protein [Verrucomicrobiota bacterium]
MEEKASFFMVVVDEEDTLQSLANAFIVDVEELAALNRLHVDSILSPGDLIAIPPMREFPPASEGQGGADTVD